MRETIYNKEVGLLVKVLPALSEENSLALHGGTAINLFYENLPRLSVDIDLTYTPIEDRNTSLRNISGALVRMSQWIKSYIPNTNVQVREDISKLIVTMNQVSIKIEVNQTKRGVLRPSNLMPLCKKVSDLYDTYCEINVVDKGLLYGGKICASLDRQHPRDLFDVKKLLQDSGITEDIKEGFFLCLLSSDRPIQEILYPTLLDQRITLEKKFVGMTNQIFNYEDFELTRHNLIEHLHGILTNDDKQFLIDFEDGKPQWHHFDFAMFPGIEWKLFNILKFKKSNPRKHESMLQAFREKLS